MNYIVVANKFGNLTAGIKAREDVENILSAEKFQRLFVDDIEEERLRMNSLEKKIQHFVIAEKWNKVFTNLVAGDNVVIQFPVRSHTVFLSGILKKYQRKKIRFILLIHDLELFRFNQNSAGHFNYRLKMEEVSVLKQADTIIVHNKAMKKKIVEMGIKPQKIIILEIFDYLSDTKMEKICSKENGIVIAGNLSEKKSKYVYKLPGGIRWNLFGPNYEESKQQNKDVRYLGAFPSDILPEKMNGSFGLVWDGESVNTCSGITGNYLKINNPHKTSLYLASGFPVIIWKNAALAGFIEKNNCGIVVNSLFDIQDIIKEIDENDYLKMAQNARTIGKKLRNGYFTKKAINKALVR